MGNIRKISVFRNGRNQAIRIPREMELPDGDATIRQDGNRLIIEPAGPTSLLELLETLTPIREEFPDIEDDVPDAVDI